MLGSPHVANALAYAWMLPFGEPSLIKGDHRLLGLDFHPDILFGSRPATPSPGLARGINSCHAQHVTKFCKDAVIQCNRHQLADHTASLMARATLTPTDLEELEAIDAELTKILKKADRQCKPLSTTPWSPTLQKAYLVHCYWALTFTAKKTEHNLTSTLAQLERRIGPELLQKDGKSLSALLRQAQRQLKKAKREADALRQRHLEAILDQATAANQKKRTKVLTYLIQAEQNQQCYARFQQHTKPKSPGGLAYVMVCDEHGQPKPLLDKEELETTLLEHSRTHFAQAEGSPFTIEPLSRLLQYDGLTPYGDLLTNGHPATGLHQFDEATKAILMNLRWKTPMTTIPNATLDYAVLMKGIRKWPEQTTTSPLGRHLGIYKTLRKHVVEKKKNAINETSTDNDAMGTITQGRDILYLIFDLMSLALKHTYPLKRWRKVWTIFIEKEMGNPDIDRLRCNYSSNIIHRMDSSHKRKQLVPLYTLKVVAEKGVVQSTKRHSKLLKQR